MKLFPKIVAAFSRARFFLKDTRAASAIEYGLIAAGLSIAIVVIVFTLGDQVEGLFQTLADEMAPYF